MPLSWENYIDAVNAPIDPFFNLQAYNSTGHLVLGFNDDNIVRHFLFELGNLLIMHDCTSILISETPPLLRQYSNYGVEEFISDGIIHMNHVEKNNSLVKTLQIVKMRGTSHDKGIKFVTFSEKGVEVHPEEAMYTDI